MAEQNKETKKTCSAAFLFDSEVMWEDTDSPMRATFIGMEI